MISNDDNFPGVWKYHARLIPFYSRHGRNLYKLVLGQLDKYTRSQSNDVFHSFENSLYCWKTDTGFHDQLKKPADPGSTFLLTIEFISGSTLVSMIRC